MPEKKAADGHEATVKKLVTSFQEISRDEFLDAEQFDYSVLEPWLSALLEKAGDNSYVVSLIFSDLMRLLLDINLLSNYDNDRLKEWVDNYSKKQAADKKYEEAKEHLDKAAALLELPTGYYYKKVDTKTPINFYGVTEYIEGRNYSPSEDKLLYDLPLFIGEGFELIIKRLPPELRPVLEPAQPGKEVAHFLGVRGQASPRVRFEVAATVALAAYVPPDFKYPYKFISELFRQCGIKNRDSKTVRASFEERVRRRVNLEDRRVYPTLGFDPRIRSLMPDSQVPSSNSDGPETVVISRPIVAAVSSDGGGFVVDKGKPTFCFPRSMRGGVLMLLLKRLVGIEHSGPSC